MGIRETRDASRLARAPRACALLNAALVVAIAAALCAGCAGPPEKKAFNNPLDPTGPSGGDPFDVKARPSGNNVTVTWTAPDIAGIATYEILHSLDNVAFTLPEGWNVPAPTTVFIDTMPAPNAYNYYKVRALDEFGLTSAVSHVTAAPILTAPYLLVEGTATQTPTRSVTLTVRTTIGDSVHVAATNTFAGALAFAALPGDDSFDLPWDLGAASGDGIWKHVYLRVKTGSALSPVAHDSIRTQFRPDLQLQGQPATVASRTLTVTITPATGVAQMRFANTRADLALLPPDAWLTGAASHEGVLLTAAPEAQWIFAEFLGDFGYSTIDSVRATPDGLTTATFQLAGGAATTTSLTVSIISGAVATQMRFSEVPDFTSLPWADYADTSEFTLSAGSGLKIVYGQFRNDWHESAVLVDDITHVPTR